MIHSFLLIGQSNMAGRGLLEEAEEIDVTRIKVLKNGRWQKMFRPINFDRKSSGVCLGESFAESYAKKYDVDVGLICCADGGTSLLKWEPGELLYDNAIFQAKMAMRTSNLAGVLWHQGESDCFEGLHTTYYERLKSFIESVRKDLGIEDLPFVVGGLGEFLKDNGKVEYTKYPGVINEASQKIANEDEFVEYATAEGLTANPDNLHFNAKSLYEFGIRYFNEFEKMKKRASLFDETLYKHDLERTYIETL